MLDRSLPLRNASSRFVPCNKTVFLSVTQPLYLSLSSHRSPSRSEFLHMHNLLWSTHPSVAGSVPRTMLLKTRYDVAR